MTWNRWRSLFRQTPSMEVEAEIAFHMEEATREMISNGMSPDRARELAEQRFGPTPEVREAMVESTARRRNTERRTELLADIGHDVKYALRQLRRSPGFATVAILTIALGIGATTAIFSVVEAVLLRNLPWTEAHRLVVPQSVTLGTDDRWSVTYRDFLTWKKDSAFARVALHQEANLDITGNCDGSACDPERLTFRFVTPEFFDVLGVKPLIGRLPLPEEFKPNSNRAIVLSYGVWQRKFGGDPGVLGRSVQLTGFPATIVGVLPRNAGYPQDTDAWYPYRAPITESTLAPDNGIFQGIARLREDRTLEETRTQLATLAAAVSAEFPQKREKMSVTATPLREIMVDRTTRLGLWTLLGAVGFVLVIACVNVANLLLVRASARERELSLRAALGSGRFRLVRQLLTESLVLAFAGGVLAVAVATALARVLISLSPADLALVSAEVQLNGTTLAAAFGVTLLAAVIFGVAPARSAAGASPAQALAAASSRTAGGRRQRRVAAVLVVAEVALSLTLLAGAGLLVKSLMRVRNVDTGLDVRRTLTFEVSLPGSRFTTRAQVTGFWDQLLQRLRTTPGVAAASVSTALPLGGGGFYLGRTMIEMGKPEPPAGPEIDIMWNVVAPDYFASVGQPLLAGRDFEARDDTTVGFKIIVSREFARRMWPNEPFERAVGKTVFSWRDERLPREVVGVAGDVRYEGATDAPRPIVWAPIRQGSWSFGTVIVRADERTSALELQRSAREALAGLDPAIAMANVQTMEDVMAASIAPQRFTALLFASFAVLALVLAVIGLYGVLAYGVARETREIGVRMALGASPGGMRLMVIRRSLTLAGVGALAGLLGAMAVTRTMEALLFEVRPNDPLVLVVVTAVLLAVAALAGWVPARRATRVDPAVALRSE